MRRESRRRIAVPAFALLFLPAGLPAQVPDADSAPGRSEAVRIVQPGSELAPVVALRAPLGAGAPAELWALPQAGDAGMPRRTKVILGAVIGGVGGTFVGEYWFGQGLDVPHGLDIAVGAALGAGIGALIGLIVDAASSDDDGSRDVTVSVMPDVVGGGASALVTIPVR